MNIKTFFLLFFCSLSFFICKQAEATDLEQTKNSMILTANLFSSIIEKVKPAVVYIQVKKKGELTSTTLHDNNVSDDFFGNTTSRKKDDSFFTDTTTFGHGSGFIINPDGYILTNSHVVANAIEITVTMTDKTQHPATLIGNDKKTDVGLIKIDKTNLPIIPLGNSDMQKTGAWVLAIGSPYEYIQSVTAGIISATGRNSLGISDYESFIQTDAAINPGNSGGPLINIHGKAIGMNTAFLTQTGGYMGIGFAIPINMVTAVTEQLLKTGKVVRAWLGVALKDAKADQLTEQGLPGTTTAARVVKVIKDSPAELSTLQKEDLIVAINNTSITSAADLRNRISLLMPESVVEITYYRNATKGTTTVTLGILDQNNQ